ncbi:unnamed protein product [Ceratitis capitata]|uniref:(Mediterranean fruit fly) hypothetical protein n=1 Tax=Ceratitis capitata TaxID=7213 RepID=A0A811VFH2_CERCA|nr:unnamed protein product [Ceratitis capitata]
MHSIVNLTKNIAKCKLKNSLTCKHDKYEYGSDRYPAVAAAEVVAAAVATATNQFQLATAKFAYFPIVLGPACSTILFHLNSGASPAALPVCRRSQQQQQQQQPHDVGRQTEEGPQAKRIQSNELAAIKVIKLEPTDDIQIIQQEIIMMRDCRHKNIITYYGSYLRRDKLWICMEYCGGGSLQDIYQVTGPLSEQQIAYMCRETLKGLEYLHTMGKMHRDIKGANILLTEMGDVKLADFGVSAQITATINKRKSFIGKSIIMFYN